MISSDRMSANLLRNWCTDSTRLTVVVDCGVVAFTGKTFISELEDDGLDLTMTSGKINLVFDESARSSAALPSDLADTAMVKITSVVATCMLTGPLVGSS